MLQLSRNHTPVKEHRLHQTTEDATREKNKRISTQTQTKLACSSPPSFQPSEVACLWFYVSQDGRPGSKRLVKSVWRRWDWRFCSTISGLLLWRWRRCLPLIFPVRTKGFVVHASAKPSNMFGAGGVLIALYPPPVHSSSTTPGGGRFGTGGTIAGGVFSLLLSVFLLFVHTGQCC